MKKIWKKAIVGTLAFAFAAVAGTGVSLLRADADELERVTVVDIATAAAPLVQAGQAAEYATGQVTYSLLWGDYTDLSNLNSFTSANATTIYKYDAEEKINCFFYYAGDHEGTVNAGRKGYETIIAAKAESNLSLTVNTAAFETSGNHLVVRTLLSDGSREKLQKENSGWAKGAAVEADALGGTYHLKAGDTLYFAVGSINEYHITGVGVSPSFTVDTEAYDETEREKQYIETVSMTQIAGYVAENEAFEKGYETESADYFLRWGDATDFENLELFTQKNAEAVYKYDAEEKINNFFYYSGNLKGRINAGKAGYETLIGVKAKENIAVTVYNAAFTATANNLLVSTVLYDGAKRYTAQSAVSKVKDAPFEADSLGGTYSLKEGDILYFIVGSSNEYTITNNHIAPSFSVDTEAYDEVEREGYYPAVKEDNEVNAAKIGQFIHAYGEYENGYRTTVATYDLLWGDETDLAALNRFAQSNASSVYKYDAALKIDCMFYIGDDGAANPATPGMISAGVKGYESVVRVTATADIALTVGNDAFVTPANNIIVKIYVTNGTTLIKLEEYTKYSTGMEIQQDTLGGTYHLKAGDVLYYVFGSTNEYPIRKTAVNPSFRTDAEGYSESARNEIYEVQEAIPAKVEQLRAYFESFDETLYTAANVILMEGYVDEFAENAASCKTLTELNELYEEYVKKIDDVPTTAETATELAAYKETKIAELNEIYNELLKTNKYSKENAAELKKIRDEAEENIKKATSKNAANTALAAARNSMNRVTTGGGSGCGSALGTSAFGAALVAALVLGKKKKSERKA